MLYFFRFNFNINKNGFLLSFLSSISIFSETLLKEYFVLYLFDKSSLNHFLQLIYLFLQFLYQRYQNAINIKIIQIIQNFIRNIIYRFFCTFSDLFSVKRLLTYFR